MLFILLILLFLSCNFFDDTIKSVDAFAITLTRRGYHHHVWNDSRNYNHYIHKIKVYTIYKYNTHLQEGFFDDFINSSFQNNNDNAEEEEEDNNNIINEADFQREVQKRKQNNNGNEENSSSNSNNEIIENEFDGYALRDAIFTKYGKCYDVDFQPVQSFGFKELYLNILPFHLNGRRFRHETELDYLCHLQAVVEILIKYDQLEYVLYQLQETKKKPRAGTSPLVAVPLRLKLDEDQLNSILA